MKKSILFILVYIFRIILSLRYRVKIVGKERLNPKNLKKSGGTLFLPNHPAALVDPALVTLALFPQYQIRPMVVEYMYFTPIVHGVMKFLRALPVPNFESSNNSLKRKRHEKVIDEVEKGLKSGENFLLYPAGRLKHTAVEKLGGASAAHRLISDVENVNIVLVKTTGLWGSSFSRALTGKVPPLFPTLRQRFWILLKNFIFFTPKRDVTIEFFPAPADFPYQANRLEQNKWLENFYNTPEDELKLVSYSFWKKDIPDVYDPKKVVEDTSSFDQIDKVVAEKVFNKLFELTEVSRENITPQTDLADDLGMDSLDMSELAMFVQDVFDTGPVPVQELTTVNRLMKIASGKIKFEETEDQTLFNLRKWEVKCKKERVNIAEGQTIPEVFLNICSKMGKSPAIADMRSGILSYSRLKIAVILLAKQIARYPGKYVGIMLPASVGAYVATLACLLAGKTPLMINWTLGSKHLKSVADLSQVEVVLSSWAFLDRLSNVDLTGIDDKIVMLESVKLQFSIFDKLKAFALSKMSNKTILRTFSADKMRSQDPAVLLFTSGSEAEPKGVPLSHSNILSALRASLKAIEVFSDDVMLGILPPFHSFGFTVTGFMGLLSGVRSAYFPNPTDGKGVAKSFGFWKVTIVLGAPTFLKAMLKAISEDQIKTLRMIVTGAEKAPKELDEILEKFGKHSCLIEGYGVTECSPIVSVTPYRQKREGVGLPIPGVSVQVIHAETHELLEKGKEGLIVVRGPNVFSGYINPQVASPFVKLDGVSWYNTGDIGYLTEKGSIVISGRKKRFVKSGGEMISLEAVESAIIEAFKDPKQELPTVVLIGKERVGDKAELVVASTFDLTTDQVNSALREAGFSSLVKVSRCEKIDEIPLMGTGKIHYRTLEGKYFKNI